MIYQLGIRDILDFQCISRSILHDDNIKILSAAEFDSLKAINGIEEIKQIK